VADRCAGPRPRQPLDGREIADSRSRLLFPADPVEVDPVDHAAPAGRVLVVREPEPFVQLALAVTVGRAETGRIHDEHPGPRATGEPLDHDGMAGGRSAAAQGRNHRPAGADLGGELSPAERLAVTGLVVLAVLERVAGGGVAVGVELRLL